MADIIIAVQYLKRIAYDNTYGYSQPRRDEAKEGDCSSDLLDALKLAGFDTGSASNTGNMLNPLLAAGFVDVTSKINLRTGDGLILADVCLRPKTKSRNGHVVMCVGSGEIVQDQADYDGVRGDSSGREIRIRPYYDSPFKYVLRYPEADVCLFAIKVVGDTWIRKSPSGEKDHIALASENLTLGIAETSGTWGRIQNQTLWISISPDYLWVKRVDEAVPPVVPKTIAVGSRYTLSGTGTSGSDNTGTRVTKSGIAKCVKIMPGTRNPYGMNWTSGNWVDAYFPASAIK